MNYLFFHNGKLLRIVKTVLTVYSNQENTELFFRWHPQFKSSNHKNKERHRIKETDGDNVSPICAPAGKWVLWNTKELEAGTGTPGH